MEFNGNFNDDFVIENIETVSAHPAGRSTGAIRKTTTNNNNNNNRSSALLPINAHHLPKNFNLVVDEINKGYKICVILRGLPGSGKSFLSDQIIRHTTVHNPQDHIVSTDNYFINNRGVYRFDVEKLSEAHEFTQKLFTRKAAQGISPLIVDNTNLKYWEMDYYLKAANQYGYVIHTMEPETPWKFSESTLSRKNQHSVPFDRIKIMKMKYETGCTVEQHLESLQRKQVAIPQMRSYPPIVLQKLDDLIDFGQDKLESTTESSKVKIQESINDDLISSKSSFQWNKPRQIFEETWDEVDKNASKIEKEEVKPTFAVPQPQRKQKKTKSPEVKFQPHRKGCLNEDARFSGICEMYSSVNDSYLWDLFVKCDGDADWCVNLLCDEDLTDQMDSGETLTCNCGSDEVELKDLKFEDLKIQILSPTVKSKKTKTKNDTEWLEAKAAIEKSIFIGEQHYPDHVNDVKLWKNGPQILQQEQVEAVETTEKSSSSSNEVKNDELFTLSIPKQTMIDLDEEFAGGLMKNFIESHKKLPSKVFVKKQTAMQLYLDLVECLYSHEEEKKLEQAKTDEELALKLNSEEQKKKTPLISNGKEILNFFDSAAPNEWEEESSDDIALKMSKEKLIQLFPQVNKEVLLEILSGTNNNFQETVNLVQDSLVSTKEERKEIERKMKNIFNSPWPELQKSQKTPATRDDNETMKGRLNTIEELRQQIYDSADEQKVLFQKANEALRNRQFEVATYYSNIAKFHKRKREEAEHEVANLICGIHETSQNSNTTIDLHYHSLIEATMLLDTFLDKNIRRLRDIKKPYEDLFVITGKGNNSKNGIPTIKNKAKSRCKERRLNCAEHENNSGVLKIKIYPNSLLTNEELNS